MIQRHCVYVQTNLSQSARIRALTCSIQHQLKLVQALKELFKILYSFNNFWPCHINVMNVSLSH